MLNDVLEKEQERAKQLLAQLNLVLNSMTAPKLTSTEVDAFVKSAVAEFHASGILKKDGTIGQNRETCVNYLTTVLPFVINEYLEDDDEERKMKNFLSRFCFSPNNRTCLAFYLQSKGLLDKQFGVIRENEEAEKTERILTGFQVLTGYSPYEKVRAEDIEEAMYSSDYSEESPEELLKQLSDEY